MIKYRTESDSFGEIKINDANYWGAATERSLSNFKIGHHKIPIKIIEALVIIKKIAAKINYDLHLIDNNLYQIIEQATDKILQGNYWHQFPLSVWQTGSGTQTNMNVNEVIASIANELLTGNKGGKNPVHPNDDVNKSQSSNDSFPTAMHIATIKAANEELLPALIHFRNILNDKVHQWQDIIKVGRTHLQDATPITLGQEFSAFLMQVDHSINRLKQGLKQLYPIAQGATAVGTGLNCPKDFSELFADALASFVGYPFTSNVNKFAALSSHDALVDFSSILNTIAVSFMKIANDIRLLGSGPRCGIGELHLPENEPGSSIMPGKVNPTQVEALCMVCAQVMGNNLTVTIAGASGHLQLNTYKPVIIYNILESIDLLSSAITSFTDNCLKDLEVNKKRVEELLNRSLMLVTALAPRIGYDQASIVAKTALKEDKTLKEIALEMKLLTSEEFDQLVDPKKMI